MNPTLSMPYPEVKIVEQVNIYLLGVSNTYWALVIQYPIHHFWSIHANFRYKQGKRGELERESTDLISNEFPKNRASK